MFTFLLVTVYNLLGVVCFWLACRHTKRKGRRIDQRMLSDYMFYYGLLWPVGAIVVAFIALEIFWNGFFEFLVDKVNNK